MGVLSGDADMSSQSLDSNVCLIPRLFKRWQEGPVMHWGKWCIRFQNDALLLSTQISFQHI